MFALYQSRPHIQHAVQLIFEGQAIGLEDLDFSHKQVSCVQKKKTGCHALRNENAPPTT